MEADRSVAKETVSGRVPSGRGEPTVAFVGIAVVGVFLAAMAGTVWWALGAHSSMSESANAEKTRALGRSVARTVEALLAANETSSLRRLIAETGMDHKLDSCRVVLPGGQVIADATPGDITLLQLPSSWLYVSGKYQETLANGKISATWPVEVPGRGSASLNIVATISSPLAANLEAMTGLGIIAGVALVGMLAAHRYTRAKLRAIAAIRQSLLAMARGEENLAALEVCPEFGCEADAWNKVLAETESLKRQLVLGHAKESLQSSHCGSGDLGAACDGLPQGLVLVDQNRRIKYANGAAAVFLQAKPEELQASEITKFVTDERILGPIQRAVAQTTYKRTVIEVQRSESDGGGVLRYIVRPVRREDAGIAMLIIEDITQQRVAEEARNTFLAQATHELRTPLTNIRLYVETALEKGEDQPEVRAKCLNVINDESRRLERIVSDILSVSEIEAGRFKIRRDDVRLDVLFEQIRADYEAQAKERNIALGFDLPPKLPVIQADRDKIALAMHNLVGNALKYTPEGGQITVHVAVGENELVIDVIDNGIGISRSDAEKIFEKFYRAKDARVANITGSGMGLALAREVIRLHGGDIVVQSELNKGSDFTVTLPITEQAA